MILLFVELLASEVELVAPCGNTLQLEYISETEFILTLSCIKIVDSVTRGEETRLSLRREARQWTIPAQIQRHT